MADYFEKSEWNEAMAKLMRIDGIMRDCYETYRNDDYQNWFKAIIGLYKEMSAWYKEPEKKRAKELKQNCRHLLLNMQNRGAHINKWDVADALVDYEEYVRTLLKRYGIDMPTAADPRRATEDGME